MSREPGKRAPAGRTRSHRGTPPAAEVITEDMERDADDAPALERTEQVGDHGRAREG